MSEPTRQAPISNPKARRLGTRYWLTKPEKYNVIDITVQYDEGGMNYFTGMSKERGYYLHITPQTQSERTITYTGFSGSYKLLRRVSRHSDKKLTTLWDFVSPYTESIALAFHADDNVEVAKILKQIVE